MVSPRMASLRMAAEPMELSAIALDAAPLMHAAINNGNSLFIYGPFV
jgi:hypothetical protein